MRGLLLLLALVTVAPASLAAGWSADGLQARDAVGRLDLRVQDQPAPADMDKGPDLDVNVKIGETKTVEAWYVDPLWLTIGGIVVLLVLILLVLALRGGDRGGTTIVK
jgi:hypothetical protein